MAIRRSQFVLLGNQSCRSLPHIFSTSGRDRRIGVGLRKRSLLIVYSLLFLILPHPLPVWSAPLNCKFATPRCALPIQHPLLLCLSLTSSIATTCSRYCGHLFSVVLPSACGKFDHGIAAHNASALWRQECFRWSVGYNYLSDCTMYSTCNSTVRNTNLDS